MVICKGLNRLISLENIHKYAIRPIFCDDFRGLIRAEILFFAVCKAERIPDVLGVLQESSNLSSLISAASVWPFFSCLQLSSAARSPLASAL